VSTRSTLKLARELLDRFFRDAEGRTNRQLDVYFTLEDMAVSRDKAEPALEYLASRGLLNTFGPDIAFLTQDGCRVAAEDIDLESVPRIVRDFEQVPRTGSEVGDAPAAESDRGDDDAPRVRPDRPLLAFVDEDGADRVVDVAWICRIGRAESNDVRIDDKRASKFHAEVRFETDRYVLHDLDSANGTLLNGEYVVEPMPVGHDDEIVIGRTLLLFQSPEVLPVPGGPRPDTAPPDRETTPSPEMAFTERPGFGDPTPIPPSIPAFGPEGRATEPAPAHFAREPEPAPPPPSRDLEVASVAPTPDAPEALEPELLDPDALVPLEGIEAGLELAEGPGDPADPAAAAGEEPADATAASELFADTVRSEPSRDATADEAATIMTTRAELFGDAFPPRSPDAGPAPEAEAPAPEAPAGEGPTPRPEAPLAVASEPEDRTRRDDGRSQRTTDPALEALEPAVLTLLGHIRENLSETPEVPQRDALLDAIDLLRAHPDVARLARAIEDQFGDV